MLESISNESLPQGNEPRKAPELVEDEYNVSDTTSSTESTLYQSSEFSEGYLAKSRLLSKAIDDIGFGKYQLGLFFVAGFGWLSDNAWPIVTSLIIPVLNETDGVHAPVENGVNKAPYLTLAQNMGLLAGALFWSLTADIIGRRWAFNLTFLCTAVWAVVAGSSPNFAALGVFAAFWSFGVGGNLPVDSAIFIENLPSRQRYLLTMMSGFWSLGQILANLLSWALIGNFSCDDTKDICLKKDNKGWRYFLFTMGGITFLMFFARFAFWVLESPKFYMSRGDNIRAIENLNKIAKINGNEAKLMLEELEDIDRRYPEVIDDISNAKRAQLSKFKLTHVRECFATRKMAFSSSLVIFTWAIIGLAFPLYNAFLPSYLKRNNNNSQPLSVHETYRNSLIVAVLGIPGAIVAGISVEMKLGRKGTLFIALLLTGVFLFASTTAKTSNANLGWNCGFSFFSNIVYGVLYAYTPEIFPTKIRGTGVGLAASANRVLGVFAPIIAIYADITTSAPIYVSGALFILAGLITLIFPYEPKGKMSY